MKLAKNLGKPCKFNLATILVMYAEEIKRINFSSENNNELNLIRRYVAAHSFITLDEVINPLYYNFE